MLAERPPEDFVNYLNNVSRQVIRLLDFDTNAQTTTRSAPPSSYSSSSIVSSTLTPTPNNSTTTTTTTKATNTSITTTDSSNKSTSNQKKSNSKSRNRNQASSPTSNQRKSRTNKGLNCNKRACNGDKDDAKSPNGIHKSGAILKRNVFTNTTIVKTAQKRKTTRTRARLKSDDTSNTDENDSLSVGHSNNGGQRALSPTSSSSSSTAKSSTQAVAQSKVFVNRDHQTINHEFDQPISSKTQDLNQLKHHQQQQSSDPSTNNELDPATEARTIDDRLTLSITDEISVLDHGSSISPPTHLSPLDPTVPSVFNVNSSGNGSLMLHQSYYSPLPHRPAHQVDSFGLQDDFNATSSNQDHIVMTPIQIQDHHEHQIGSNQNQRIEDQSRHHQPDNSRRIMTVIGGVTEIVDDPVLMNPSERCYTHSNHSQAQNHPQHSSLSTLNQHAQYHPSLDHQHHHQHQGHDLNHHQHHQWLLPSNDQSNQTSFQLSVNDSGPLIESTIAHPLSPATHQSLDQVHFSAPLYQHSYYNNHQQEHINSFQHITDDYANTNTLVPSSSSPIGHLTMRGEHRSHQTSIQTNQSNCLSSIDSNGTSNANNYNQHQDPSSHHNSHPHHEHHQTQHHQHQMQQQIQQSVSDRDEAHSMMDSPYSGTYDPQRQVNHYHQHHQHHLLPLINGIEPNAVIIQDINLASATWSSPEDLYSI